MSRASRVFACTAVIAVTGGAVLGWATLAALESLPPDLAAVATAADHVQVTDRHGVPLSATYANTWNVHQTTAIHAMPDLLISAFVQAEDKRFFAHGGPDWAARLSALGQNLAAMRRVRGASTITEQVVRMIHPRPRTVWTRWLEGWEAMRLERRLSKLDILEFYLNQVPYAANRRGVSQAARYYFDRDLETLDKHEMLALATLVRAPSRLDLFTGDRQRLRRTIARLGQRMRQSGLLSAADVEQMAVAQFDLRRPHLPVQAPHFLQHVRALDTSSDGPARRRLRTTLDGSLQQRLAALVDQHLKTLATRRVANAALLVADHQSGEILAWVVGGAGDDAVPGYMIDAVTTPRQPGSALKPFLYALAIEKGWTTATLIDDAPLSERVGYGLHRYHNYSRTFHGPVTLRDALGNSLNIPAVRTIQFTGTASYLTRLERAGFRTLSRHPDHYGDGLALGNGEVTLLELVQAYGALANRGVYREFAVRRDDVGAALVELVYSAEIASVMGNILSDPDARQLEFGSGSLLNLPVQTAVKTGTSSDYRDSWAVGYNDRHVVGVWMGNQDQRPTLGITGSTGPALVLRAAFDLLTRHQQTARLWLSPRLRRYSICADSGIAYVPGMTCPRRSEYFLPGSGPERADEVVAGNAPPPVIRLRQPTPGLHLAYDPRLPADQQGFEFVLQGVQASDLVEWYVDGRVTRQQTGPRYLWPVARGGHSAAATVWRDGQRIASVAAVQFLVK